MKKNSVFAEFFFCCLLTEVFDVENITLDYFVTPLSWILAGRTAQRSPPEDVFATQHTSQNPLLVMTVLAGVLRILVCYPTLEALAEPAKNEPCETACRMAEGRNL